MGARAAYIAGAAGTACTICERDFHVPALGTMAHSWVQMFDNEFEAFKAYALTYPNACTVLVDTYNVLRSGIPNAIRVAKEVLEPMGCRMQGVRIDSGDITYLSRKAREMLDAADMKDCKIVVSNSLDEFLVRDLLAQGACIAVGGNIVTDAFGVVAAASRCSAGSISWQPLRIRTAPSFQRSRSPKMWKRSPTPISSRSGV